MPKENEEARRKFALFAVAVARPLSAKLATLTPARGACPSPLTVLGVLNATDRSSASLNSSSNVK